MQSLSSLFRAFALLLLAAVAAPASAQSECSHYALVSGYNSNVHIYDGCSGAFLRILDAQEGRLAGAQALKIGPDGRLWVVSEQTAQVHRYRADDFSFVDTPINVGSAFGLTGIAFRGSDTVYACGYDSSTVRSYGLDGSLQATPVPATTGVRGFDNGMTFGPDNLLYVPGYDTHNILRHDPATGTSSVLVAAGSGGLRNSRGILFRPDGATFLVSSEGSGQILEYRRDNGSLVRELARGITRPTGMAFAPDGSLAVAFQTGVVRLDPDTGAVRGNLVSGFAGGLIGPTYVTFLPKAIEVDRSQVGTQFWISGAGRLDGRRLVVDSMLSTTGPAFGADFDPQDAVSKRWGQLIFDFNSCTTGTVQWNSTGDNSARFGSGSFPIGRLLAAPGVQRCLDAGFAQSSPEDWLAGVWSGGAVRSGEGFVFEYINANTVVAAWFTHRPASVQ
jgi:hypothetical protein